MKSLGKVFWRISVNIHWSIKRVELTVNQISLLKRKSRAQALVMLSIKRLEAILKDKTKCNQTNLLQIKSSRRRLYTLESTTWEMDHTISKCWFLRLMISLFLLSIWSSRILSLSKLKTVKLITLSVSSIMILDWWPNT